MDNWYEFKVGLDSCLVDKVVYYIEELSSRLGLWKEDGLDVVSIGKLWTGSEVGIILR